MSQAARSGEDGEEGEQEDEAARGSRRRHRSRHEAPAGGGRSQERHERKRKKREAQQLQKLQHLESFYEKPPPGLIKENETKPEDCIPDVPGNESAREFLAHAPTKGLWMPLGKEVKVMQCWRCKRYGHRTGDKECPFFIKGNQKLEQFRVAHEDPMYDLIRENKRHEKEMRIQQLKQLLEDSTSEDDDSDGSSEDDDESSSSSTSSECRDKHKKKKRKKEKKKKEKKKKKKKKHKSSKSNEKLESD
ncbi:retinitis pigmentosa 9 protein [Nothoprocta perdicaria]|uniref:retinitis pigmentosa 9 protein n=1 Tax=Nothoprocta perdicaria TaxID=30464 RepID=UPI000E1BAF6C|nr:retinitis pigmentosa 9 protein [Nothoprocta perdicaria]